MLNKPSPPALSDTAFTARTLWARLAETRQASADLAAPLSDEDMVVQAEDDASPTKWHLAHVTWFFEEFVLRRFLSHYPVFDPRFNFCFNSYYEALGPRHPRALRGLLTRPSVPEVMAYRRHVDEGLEQLLSGMPPPEALALIELGINHEQQHQELILTDILALFARSPLRPAYTPNATLSRRAMQGGGWKEIAGGIYRMGFEGDGFAWDNEGPAHDVLLRPFAIARHLVTNGDWLEFMNAGGYRTASLWLSDGWSAVQSRAWQAPRYWEAVDGLWNVTTLAGRHVVDPNAPVEHISYYEADAFARWAGCRLPTEAEWEVAATTAADGLHGLFGDVWQWTGSAYLAYPGYVPPKGAVGEYNGKFMVGQHVLRGSSLATPRGHSRPTYRNFFYPHQRWQFTGLRLAKELS